MQATTQLVPPYSVYLSDYATPGNEKLRVILLQRDLSQPAYQVRLVMSVQLNGRVIIRTTRSFTPSPINLTPGIPTVISGADLFPYLDSRNLDFVGYSREQYERTKALPEGGYQITFTAYDYRRQDVQISNAGSSFYYLSKSEPPLINVPACGTKVPMRTPQQIVFSWLPRNTASPTSVADTQYELSLYEVRPQGRNPNDIVVSTQPVFKATLNLPQYVYTPADPLLLENMQYVWRVRAIDRNGKDAFRNNGYSEICTFTYTSEGTIFDIGTVKNLKAEGQTPTRGRIWWDLGEYDSYQVGYRKTGNASYEWFPARVTTKELKEAQKTQAEVKLFDLEPDTEYEARVQAQKSGYLGAYSEIVKFRTWPVQPSNCGADEDDPSIPEADDDHPLVDGIRGMIIQLDDLEMQLMEVVHLGQGWYQGTGRTRVPFLGNGNFAVTFDRLYIDENRVAGDGRVDFVTRGTIALVEQQMQHAAIKAREEKKQENRSKWTGTVFHNRIFEYSNIVIDTITVSPAGIVEITDDQGQVTMNTEVAAILATTPEKAIIIEDRKGDQYVVRKDKSSGQTSVTKVNGGGLAIDEAGNILDKKTLRKLDKMILAALKKYRRAIEDYQASIKKAPAKGKGGGPSLFESEIKMFYADLPQCLNEHKDKINGISVRINTYLDSASTEAIAFRLRITESIAKEFPTPESQDNAPQERIDAAVCSALVIDEASEMIVLAPLDVGTYDPLDPRILKKIQENISAINVNMQNAPAKFMNKKTIVAYGRKWNARWAFHEIDQLYPYFWSAANKAKIRIGELPVVDEKYLQFIGKGLSPDDFKKLKAAAPISSSIEHHHMNHGNFAVSLETNIHRITNTKFWHHPKFRNIASRTLKSMSNLTAKSLLIIGFAISIQEVISGDLSSAVSSMSGLPQNGIIEDVSINLVQEGLLSDTFEKVKIGLTLLEDERFTVYYWSADDLLAYLNGEEIKENFVTHTIDEQWSKDFPYLVVKFEGEMIGIVNIPD